MPSVTVPGGEKIPAQSLTVCIWHCEHANRLRGSFHAPYIHFCSLILQGKPSAGKSTFFNAAVGQDLAKTGAFPFTTIEPNVKQTVYAIPCPCQKWDKQCDSGKNDLGAPADISNRKAVSGHCCQQVIADRKAFSHMQQLGCKLTSQINFFLLHGRR